MTLSPYTPCKVETITAPLFAVRNSGPDFAFTLVPLHDIPTQPEAQIEFVTEHVHRHLCHGNGVAPYFYAVGTALRFLRERGAYRNANSRRGAETWDKYLHRFNLDRQRYSDLLVAIRAYENLAAHGIKLLPRNIEQALSLRGLTNEQQVTIWSLACENAKNGCPSGAEVRKAKRKVIRKKSPSPGQTNQAEAVSTASSSSFPERFLKHWLEVKRMLPEAPLSKETATALQYAVRTIDQITGAARGKGAASQSRLKMANSSRQTAFSFAETQQETGRRQSA